MQISPELADAADVLSDQLRVHLKKMSRLLEPHTEKIERRFVSRMRQMGISPMQRSALSAITTGAAARILARNKPALQFIEQVEYNGRRLAKMNLPPSAILEALQEYDRLLAPMLVHLRPDQHANFQWVREQLHFCVVLTLNNAYYQVREAETHAFYELFRAELESRTLDELLMNRVDIDPEVAAAIAEEMLTAGVEVTLMAIKDVVLPGEIREILNQVVAAEKRAQANLIQRREETAATRSLLNTAKLMEDSPVLMRLKELETLEKLTEKVGMSRQSEQKKGIL